MKKVLTSFIATILSMSAYAQTASVMAIHNSPDPALDSVDMYLLHNGNSTLLKNNFAFREATAFANVPAESPIRIVFAGKGSTSIADSVVGFGYNLPNNGKFILIAQGHFQSGFNPQKAFELKVIGNAENAASSSGNKLLVYHGSTDAPSVDINAFTVRTAAEPSTLVESASYGANTAYISVPNDDYFVNISVAGEETALLTYSAPLKTLNANGEPVVVFASGFLNPSQNLNGKPFGLFAVLRTGTVIELPLQSTAKLQIVHNAPDALASTVDIWSDVSGTIGLLKDNLNFRTATPFLTIPANKTFKVWVAPGNSTSYTQNVYELELNVPGGMEISALAQGVLDTSKHENGPSVVFDIYGVIAPTKSFEAGKVTLAIAHGSTDAPAVDVRVGGANGTLLASNLMFSDNTESIVTDANDITVSVLPAGTSSVVASYIAPLSAFRDSSIVVMASGFLSPNVPSGKDAGAGFGLYAVTASGRVIALPLNTTSVKNIKTVQNVTLFPNPIKDVLNIETSEKVNKVIITTTDGRVVLESLNSKEINTSDLANGMYLVQVVTDNGNFNSVVLK